MKGHSFDSVEYLKKKMRMEHANIKTGEFEECFQQWQHRLYKCIKLQGKYVKGVKVFLKKKIKYTAFKTKLCTVIFGPPLK